MQGGGDAGETNNMQTDWDVNANGYTTMGFNVPPLSVILFSGSYYTFSTSTGTSFLLLSSSVSSTTLF